MMKGKLCTYLLACTLFLLGCSDGASAQTLSTLDGHVTDPRGAAVAGAHVTLYGRAGALRLFATTDEAGAYHFARLTPGEYVLEVEKPGFASASAREVRVRGGENLTVETKLQLAALREQVVVTASGTAQLTDETSKAISVVSSEEIERRDELAIAEALRTTPGLRVEQLGGPGAFTAIRIRGQRSEDTSLLIDGFRFRDAASTQGDSSAFLEDLLVVNTARLEILRGSGSSLYGSHAIGGAVNIVTEEGGGEPRGQVQLEGGGLGLFRGRASLAGSLFAERFIYSAGLAHLNVTRGVDGRDAARNTSGQLRLQYNFTPAISLAGRMFASTAFLQLNDSAFAAPAQAFTPPLIRAVPLALDQQRLLEARQPFSLGSANFIPALDDPDNSRASGFFAGLLILSHRVTDGFSYRLSYSRVATRRVFRDGPGGVGPFGEPMDNNRSDLEGATDTLQARADARLGRYNLITAGYEFEREEFESRSVDTVTDSQTSVGQRSNTIFLQDQLSLLDGRLQFSIAGRAQYFNLSTPVLTPSSSSPYSAAPAVESPKAAYTGDASAAYFIAATSTKLRAHVGNGYRSPSSFERFGSTFSGARFTFFGDPRLRPERSVSADAGIDQPFFRERLRASATIFYTRLQEVIVFDFSGLVSPATDPFGRAGGYRNTGGGIARGIELGLTAAPVAGLDLSLAYTYTNADGREINDTGTTRLFGTSDHTFSLQANQRIGERVNLNLDFFAYSDYVVSLSGRAYLFDGPIRADLGGSYTWPLKEKLAVRLHARVENLFGRELFESGFRTPGRVGLAGITFSF